MGEVRSWVRDREQHCNLLRVVEPAICAPGTGSPARAVFSPWPPVCHILEGGPVGDAEIGEPAGKLRREHTREDYLY